MVGLLMVLMPLSGYFGFNRLMVLPALWALYEYLQLMGQLGDVGIPVLYLPTTPVGRRGSS
jgi:hypothetical protein